MPVFREMLFTYFNFHQYLVYPTPFSESPLPFGTILSVTHRYPLTRLQKNITGMSVSQFMCTWEATKQRQCKTSLGFCHITTAMCIQEMNIRSPYPNLLQGAGSRFSHPCLCHCCVGCYLLSSACTSPFLLSLLTYSYTPYFSFISYPLFCFLPHKAS